MTAPQAELTNRAADRDGRTETTGVGAGRWGMRLSVWCGIGITVFVVGCDSNPTPHPQNPDVKNGDATGGQNEPDRDNDFASGDAADVYDGDGGPPWSNAEGDACGEVDGDVGPHLDNGRDDAVEGDGETTGEEACPGSDDQAESSTDDGDGDGADSGGRGSSAGEPASGGPPRPIGARGR